MKTLILKIEYDGFAYSGWQKQLNSNSIQDEIEKVLSTIYQTEIKIIGAGRTDAGVHSNGQVATTDLENPDKIPLEKITKALNSYLPKDIRILGSAFSETHLNARFDAIAREYIYHISTKEQAIKRNYINYIKFPIDFEILKKSADIFIGNYDFTTFSKLNLDTKNYTCNVEISQWQEIEPMIYRYRIKANRFVYGMVRSLVGTMVDAARGKIELDNIKNCLLQKDRSLNSPLAAAKGLILENIYFADETIFI